jgi:hypothetical protein
MLKPLSYVITAAALCLSANASARTWSSVYEFWFYSELPYGVRSDVYNNLAQLHGISEPQVPACGATSRFYWNRLRAQSYKIEGEIKENFRFNSNCTTSLSYYGDAEIILKLVDIHSGHESLIYSNYGTLRLDASDSETTRTISIHYPDWMQPGRYRAKLYTRVPGKTAWRMAHIDFRVH